MEHVVTGHDVLAVLPTGAGKSAIYQVPAGTSTTHDPGASAAAEAAGLGNQAQVEHPHFGEGMVMSTEDDRITVLFAEHGDKTLSLDAVRERELLVPAERPGR